MHAQVSVQPNESSQVETSASVELASPQHTHITFLCWWYALLLRWVLLHTSIRFVNGEQHLNHVQTYQYHSMLCLGESIEWTPVRGTCLRAARLALSAQELLSLTAQVFVFVFCVGQTELELKFFFAASRTPRLFPKLVFL